MPPPRPARSKPPFIGTPVRWNASTLVVGASAGVALLGALDTPADVIARADAAMYARKTSAREFPSPRAGRGMG